MKYLILPLLFVATAAVAQPASSPAAPPSLLASAVIAGLVSAAVSGLISLLVKNTEYKNDYYKKVIDKRIKAIEAAEAFVSLLGYVHDSPVRSGEKYHGALITEDYTSIHEANQNIIKSSAWYGAEIKVKIVNILNAVAKVLKDGQGKSNSEKILIAEQSFLAIQLLLGGIEQDVRKDMSSLHNVSKFFKSTTSKNG